MEAKIKGRCQVEQDRWIALYISNGPPMISCSIALPAAQKLLSCFSLRYTYSLGFEVQRNYDDDGQDFGNSGTIWVCISPVNCASTSPICFLMVSS